MSLQSHAHYPKYRRDIDGLRAIAVLSVVIYHAFPNSLQGGFVGVDIFFVISGFLISTIIFESLESNTFKFQEFYARRIRRILPALILLLGSCFAFGWFVLLSDEYQQLGKHIFSSSIFMQNITLWREAGYFDNSAETKPLLHLWSLAVEVQFYVFFPLLLWASWKKKFNLLTLTLIISAISLYLNLAGVEKDATATFYSPQTRFWELLFGSILGWIVLFKYDRFDRPLSKINHWLNCIFYRKGFNNPNLLADILSFIGLALIIWSVSKIKGTWAFPGGWAIIPVLGASLIIAGGPKAWINRYILSNRLAVWIGVISYPLYLWHWSLLSFIRIIDGKIPHRDVRISIVGLSIVLATLTYVLIERPIRFGSNLRRIAIILSFLMILIGTVGFLSFKDVLVGYHKNLETTINIGLSESINRKSDYAKNCRMVFPDWNLHNDNPCLIQNTSNSTVAIIGDSHAARLFFGLERLFKGKENLAVFSASGAAPFIDISTCVEGKHDGWRKDFYRLINNAFLFILSNIDLNIVIMTHFPSCSFNNIIDIKNPENKNYESALQDGMRRTFVSLIEAKKNIIYVLDNPLVPFDPKQCQDRRIFSISSEKSKCLFPRSEHDENIAFQNYRRILLNVAKDFPQIQVLDLSTLLCDNSYCYLKNSGNFLYADTNHLSYAGSIFVSQYIANAINNFRKYK